MSFCLVLFLCEQHLTVLKLHGILDSRRQIQAQQSSIKMEQMSEKMQDVTFQMHEIARKTQRETVSMRIITLVTLFFLPGTFIAVRTAMFFLMGHTDPRQGFMNTTIVQWKKDDQTGESHYSFERSAMWFFMYTVGPLTLATFCLWGLFFWYIKRQERKARGKHQAQLEAEKSALLEV